MTRIYRSTIALTLSAISLFLLATTDSAVAQSAPKNTLEVRLGWLTFAGGTSAITAYLIKNKLFEKYASQFGYEITANWKSFPSGPSLNEAMAAGQLDIDMHMSALPSVSRIAAGVPAIPIGVFGSHLSNALMVAPNSQIKDVSQLPGKTVGLVIGSASHYLLASIVYYHFGKSLEELNVKLVNMPVSEAVKMPGGIDVAAVWQPLRFIGPYQGISELLVDGDGNTGRGHRTPGVRLPEAKKSWAYPEGYNTDRIYAFARDKFLAEHPNLVLAFLLAYMDGQAKIVADTDGAAALINEYWKLPNIIVQTTLQTQAETAGIRKTPAILEWDVLSLIKASEFLTFMKLRDRPLTWEDLKPLFMKSAEIQRRAWEMSKPQVSLGEMKKGFTGSPKLYGEYTINGGAPVWEWNMTADWGRRIYVPGPFRLGQ